MTKERGIGESRVLAVVNERKNSSCRNKKRNAVRKHLFIAYVASDTGTERRVGALVRLLKSLSSHQDQD